MKKTGLFKIIMFVLLGMIVATWIFSAGFFSEGSLQDLGMYSVGFFDYFSLIFGTFEFTYFLQIFILLVSIGALYGVHGKTGKYRAWIEKIVNNAKGSEFIFLIIIAFAIAILTSVFDFGLCLFIFFPFLISIILAMGYEKTTAIVATFGAMLVGTIGNTLGYNTSAVINDLLGIGMTQGILFKLALFVFSLAALILYLSKVVRVKGNRKEKELEADMFIGEKISNKYSIVPLLIIFALMFVFLVLGCTNWGDGINIVNILTILALVLVVSVFVTSCSRNKKSVITLAVITVVCAGLAFLCFHFGTKINAFNFEDVHTAITEFKIKLPYLHITQTGFDTGVDKVAIFSKIFGSFQAFGSWNYAEMSIVVLVAALLLSLFYHIENKFMTMLEGAKKMLVPGLMVVVAYMVIYFAGNQMFYPTIAGLILSATSKFSVILDAICVAIGSALHVDILYVANYVVPQLAANEAANATLVGIITQSIYGVTMFIAPTSAFLVLGLTYLDIPYKEWVKKTWKLVVALLIIVIAILLLAKFL